MDRTAKLSRKEWNEVLKLISEEIKQHSDNEFTQKKLFNIYERIYNQTLLYDYSE